MASLTVTITLLGSPIEIDKNKRALEQFAKLPIDDQNRLSEIIKNQKALSSLKKNWLMLKAMF